MAAALPAGYELLGRRGRYGRAVEVYGITRVARSSAIAFGWCTCCGAPTRWRRRRRGEPSVSRVGWLSCSGPGSICVTVMQRGRSVGTAWPWPAGTWRTSSPPDLPAQDERSQRAHGPTLVGPPRRPVHVPASAGVGRHQLAGRTGDPLRGHPPQGLGWQPDLGGRASAVGPDVGVADVLATRTFG